MTKKTKISIWIDIDTHAEMTRRKGDLPYGAFVRSMLFNDSIPAPVAPPRQGKDKSDLVLIKQEDSSFTEIEARLGHMILNKIHILGANLRGADLSVLAGRKEFWPLVSKLKRIAEDRQAETQPNSGAGSRRSFFPAA